MRLFRADLTEDMTSVREDHDRWRDVRVALDTAASVQRSIRHADTKAAALIGVLGSVVTLAADSLPVLAGGWWAIAAAVLGAGVAVGTAVTGHHLLRAMTPRLAVPGAPNRFAFPAIAAGRLPDHDDVTAQHDEARVLVTALARIAMIKHERVRAGIPWLAVTAACAVAMSTVDALRNAWG